MNLANFTDEQLQETAQQLINQAEEIIDNLNKVEGVVIKKTSTTMYAIIEVKLYDVLYFIKEFEALQDTDLKEVQDTKDLVYFWKKVLSKIKSNLNDK